MPPHVCPWWLGYFHLGPVRRLLQNPGKILKRYVRAGMRAVEIGCGMGFFTLDLAKLVGPDGHVTAIDLQPRMISALERRAARAGLSERIDTRICNSNSLGVDDLNGSADFVAAFYVVHEVPDVHGLMGQVDSLLSPGGLFMVAEPSGRVTAGEFEETIAAAVNVGFELTDRPEIRKSRSAVFVKK